MDQDGLVWEGFGSVFYFCTFLVYHPWVFIFFFGSSIVFVCSYPSWFLMVARRPLFSFLATASYAWNTCRGLDSRLIFIYLSHGQYTIWESACIVAQNL